MGRLINSGISSTANANHYLITMNKTYTDIWTLAEDIVKAIEAMQEADRKMGFCQDNLIPAGYEESIDSLKDHAIDVRDFYFEGEPDGEGGEVAVGEWIEWSREVYEPAKDAASYT